MEIQTRTDKGRVRLVNEDAVLHFTAEPYEIILLADGLGGHRAGEVASRMVVENMRDYLLQHDLNNMPQVLKDAVTYANEQVHRCQQEDANYAGMGSTLVAAIANENAVHIAHVGDSRAYLCNEDGLVQLTIDHSVSNDIRNSGQVNENLRHMLTRAMGTEPTIHADFQKIERQPGSILLLCSDGLANEMTTKEINEVLCGEGTLAEKADTLIATANENGGRDNITLALCMRKGETA